MAFKYRNNPKSFSLPREFVAHFRESQNVDTDRTLFGFQVLFTKTKKKEWLEGGHAPVTFLRFFREFGQWVKGFSAKERGAAAIAATKHKGVGLYPRRGVYRDNGDYLGTYQEVVSEGKIDPTLLAMGMIDVLDSSVIESSTSQTSQATSSTTTSKKASKKKSFTANSAKTSSARVTHAQAKDTTQKAQVLDTSIQKRTSYSQFNLGDRQRPLSFTEVHVPVARGNYRGVTQKIVAGPPGGYVITGPTGCGKSTVALLPLFSGKSSVLIVEPTQANAANIFHEFSNVLPTLHEAGVIPWNVPPVEFTAPTTREGSYGPLSVTTTDKLLEYFEWKGSLPKVDYLIIDEFHLPIPSMVQTVELLRTFALVPKYIFVSATAVGYSVNPELPKAVTQTWGQLPIGQIPSKMEGSDLDPRRWWKRGDGNVAVVAPSVIVAKRLFNVYRDWQIRAFLITRETFVSEYMKAATNYRSMTTFVLEPGVEAGVTLCIDVLISMGASTAIRYDGKVVLEDTQPLDKIAAIQRGGRGGRVVPTLYITPRLPEALTMVSSADYYRAQSIVRLIAAGADVSRINDRGLFQTFPRLRTVSRQLASAAVSVSGDPFVALYQRADDGQIYSECGGTGSGFDRLAKQELFLYHYPGGFFVAPIVDFTDLHSNPDSFVLRQSQLSAAHQIVEAIPGLEDSYSLDDLIGLLIAKFDVYVSDLFTRLTAVFSEPAPTQYGIGSKTRSPDVTDFLTKAPEISKLFVYMTSQPCGVIYERGEFEKNGTKHSTHSFIYKDTSLHFAFSARFMNDHVVNVDLLGKEIHSLLKGLLAIEILIEGAPNKCVNLFDYKHRVPREHLWFSQHVGRT
uniref:Genome polyprotein n=2 Tax=unclassified Virgaviridae TaxID=1527522 RepID=A0A172T0U1_9VIRU|nr:movement protein [Macrophomina phaseolina tobamo-like virus 1a]